MIRHTRLSGRRSAGFSMVEALVTSVIAGVVFAATAPVLVSASQSPTCVYKNRGRCRYGNRTADAALATASQDAASRAEEGSG